MKTKTTKILCEYKPEIPSTSSRSVFSDEALFFRKKMCDRNEQVLPLGFNDFPYRVFMHVFFVGVCACMSVHVYACMHVRKYVCMFVCS